ncbi:hypothetical protein SAMN04488587_0103 [Methanococcoides vulcani]|uniref:Uncharacterized protein n=1 Tax=Methanococcoides vulcani TaxID=1353158 RepID=A0A1H9Y0Y4_9EURY|nr:hypothetical protein SAMN04488587_0103 [Methanococcoides vulcani]
MEAIRGLFTACGYVYPVMKKLALLLILALVLLLIIRSAV